LLSYSYGLEIVSPKALREELIRRFREAAKMYEK
jgi:hypothetical protein